MFCFILDYLDRLFQELQDHLVSRTTPLMEGPDVTSLASTGPAIETDKPFQRAELGKNRLFITVFIS